MSPCGGYRDKGWKLQICLRECFSNGISDSLYPFFSATVRCCLPYHVQHLFHISPHPGLQPPGAAHQHWHTDLRSTAVHVSHKGLGGPQCTLSFVGAGHNIGAVWAGVPALWEEQGSCGTAERLFISPVLCVRAEQCPMYCLFLFTLFNGIWSSKLHFCLCKEKTNCRWNS